MGDKKVWSVRSYGRLKIVACQKEWLIEKYGWCKGLGFFIYAYNNTRTIIYKTILRTAVVCIKGSRSRQHVVPIGEMGDLNTRNNLSSIVN